MDTFDRVLAEPRGRLLNHALYAAVDSPERLRVFTRNHVFAVWDFMSLLKRLQHDVTCLTIPWRPASDGGLARFVNEIVIAEESDEDGRGGFTSHFELYLAAMREIGGDTGPIERLLGSLSAGRSVTEALAELNLPAATKAFVAGNLTLATDGAPHEVAAAFCFGREDVIPDMFERLIATLEEDGRACPRLKYYLERHVELDGDEHGPWARRLVTELCAGDPVRLEEAATAARAALEARIALWDGVLAELGGAASHAA